MQTRLLRPTLGVAVIGVDLAAPLLDADIAAIKTAMAAQ